MFGGIELAKKNKKFDINASNSVAESTYHPSHYKGNSQLEKGLAETHELISDQFTEGTVDQLIDK